MHLIIILLLGFFLTGCPSGKAIKNKQESCESQYTVFEEVVKCTKENFMNDPMARKSPDSKLYFLKGEQLVEKVKKGEITELDARTEWQSLYVELRHKAAMRGNSDSDAPYKVKQTHCVPVGNTVQCTTY